MPRYEYRCRTCGAVYEERRRMAEADDPATCPSGHAGATRLLPVFATIGRNAGTSDEQIGGLCGAPAAGGCGAGCACHPG
jgi:putative FmdB family regulatory protein